MILNRALWAIFWISLAFAQTNTTTIRLGDIEKQTWNWGPDARCRLLAHESIVINHGGKDLLIFDGGLAKFKYKYGLNGTDIEILELIIIDLSQPFTSGGFIPLSQEKKPLGVPVVNRFGLWKGSNQNSILMQGHFYDGPDWRNSSYWLEKKDIPLYSIWEYNRDTFKWSEIPMPDEDSKHSFKRGFGGAAVSVPRADKSYYIGGLWTSRSSRESLDQLAVPLSGMLVYDHKSGKLTNESFGEEGKAYWHGSADYLEIGKGTGFLIALMAETDPGGVPVAFDPGDSNEHGSALSFEHIMLYDIDNKKWINQTTTFYNNELPVPRTRFCGQTVFSNETKTWELWIHGGMLIEPLGDAAPDAWVLTMPSFIWARVEVPDSIARMRSHPCNAVGSQLLIVGGYPSSVRVDITAPSDSELIKVLDMNEMSWSSRYTPGTIYKTPDLVRKKAEFHLGRIDPHSGWADDGLRDAFHYSINGTTSGKPPPQKLSGGEIAAIAVSIVIGVPLLLFVIFCLIFGSLPKPQSPPPDRPFSNRPNPEVVEERPARPIDLWV